MVLEFDHLSDKRTEVSMLVKGWSWNTVMLEIAKCEVVCANCHRRRTYARANSHRTQWAASSGQWGRRESNSQPPG